MVGDADQSIYAFRGATIRNIDEFERDYPDAKTVLLEQNYRSTQTILNTANAVIARNPDRRPKSLWSDSGSGELIEGFVAENEHDEARWVAKQIDALTDAGQAKPSDVAVFYRTNAQSGCSKRSSSASACPTRSSAACASTSARRSATSWPTCGCWPTRGLVSLRRILNTPVAASAIGPRQSSRSTPSRSGSPSPALERVEHISGLATRSANSISEFVKFL